MVVALFTERSVFEAELEGVIPICRCTINGTRIIGRLTAGYVCAENSYAIYSCSVSLSLLIIGWAMTILFQSGSADAVSPHAGELGE